MQPTNIILNGRGLSIEQVLRVAEDFAKVEIAEEAIENVIESQLFITNQVELGKIVYGVTTGFGINADKVIEQKDASDLQRNLLLSHACGVGKPFDESIVRAIMTIRLNTLLAGHSGVRLETIRLLQQFINYGIHPVIPEQGSVGASGDLCPLSHMSIPLMGEGLVYFEGRKIRTSELYALPQIKAINAAIEASNKSRSEQEKMPLIAPIELSYKEGIGLSNGTTLMVSLGVFGVSRAKRLMDKSILSAALLMEGHCSRPKAFDHKIHVVRKHSGQTEIAKRVRELTAGSTMIGINPIDILRHFPKTILLENADYSVLTNRLTQLQSHLQKQIGITNNLEVQIKAKERLVNVERLLRIEAAQDFLNYENLENVMDFIPKLFCDFLLKYMPVDLKNRSFWQDLVHIAKRKITPQDAYSIRCFPQVFGASLKAIEHAEAVITEELNAVVDNPIIFMENQVLPNGTKVMENDVISGGNFHGQPIALVLDYMKLAVAEMGNIMERQINKMVDAATNDGLPPFLIQGAGLNNGLMIPQYTAAAIVSENKVLVHPASADSIPTSANQEDHVSMGPIAGRQLLQIITNVQRILAIHILTAKQAVAMRLKQFDTIVPTQMAEATKALYEEVEALGVTTIEEDRFLWEDIDKLMAIVR